MKHLRLIVGVVVLAIAAGPALADKNKEEKVKDKDNKAQVVKGRIADVSVQNKQFVVKGQDGKEVKFQLGAGSKVRFHNRDATLSQFKDGERVKVFYETDGNINRVVFMKGRLDVEDIGRAIKFARDKLQAFTAKNQGQFVMTVEQVLGDVEDLVDDLLDRAKDATGDARKEMNKEAEELKAKSAEVGKKLAKLKSAGAAAFDEIKDGLAEALKELEKASEHARLRFEKERPSK